MSGKESKATHVTTQEMRFNIKGTKAMGKETFVSTWEALAKDRKGKGVIGRFKPKDAYDKIVGKEKVTNS